MKIHDQPLKSYKILGIFLSYPSGNWVSDAHHLLALIKEEKALNEKSIADIEVFVKTIQKKDLLEIQEHYVSLFDRSRDLSLYLFEHVHGESKDRGQAMLDLLAMYEQKGFELNKNELPDFIPLFLEFLSFLPSDEAKEFINDCVHIIAKIATSAMQRDSLYIPLFNGIIDLAGHKPIKFKIPLKGVNDWMKDVDLEWEEKQVTFMNADEPNTALIKNCGGGCSCASKTKSSGCGASSF